MKKKYLILSLIIIIITVLITQRYRIFYTYKNGVIDSVAVVLRTNVITGETEMLEPSTLIWIDSNRLLEIKEKIKSEEKEGKIAAINKKIQRYQDILDGKEELEAKSIEHIFARRTGVEIDLYLKNEIKNLKKELDEMDGDE